jgi:transcription elongation factor
MKRSILAVAAVLALGSASAYAQTAGVQPSFNDAPDLASIALTDRATAQYAEANASRGASISDAQNGDAATPTLNDTFNYPAY